MKDPIRRVISGLNRRWQHTQNNQIFRAAALEIADRAPITDQRPVVVFNASTRLGGVSLNAGFSLLTAWSLRLSGVPVVHFVCQQGLSRCVLGTKRHDPHALPPCRECVKQSNALYEGAQVRPIVMLPDPSLEQELLGMDLQALLAIEVEGLPLGQLVLPSLRWILRCHTLNDNENTRFLVRQYLLSAWSTARQFSELLDEVNPQAVLVFNGMFYPEATARYIAKQRGIRVVSHEVGLRPYTGFFTTGDATAYPIDIPQEFELDAEQNERLDDYLSQRFNGNFSMAGIRFWPELRPLDEEFLKKAAGFKQIVPVFTNVIFDTSQGHANVIFPDMFAWLDQALDVMRAHPETLFVIRAHPDETRPGKESHETVAQWVEQSGAVDLPNVVFVPSDQYFSSYDLIRRSKFVMVYNSTIGLEASLLGAAVLCGGKARFTQLATVFFPQSVNEYRAKLEEFLLAESISVPEEFARNARRFLYYQLFKTSLPFGDFIEEDGVYKGYVKLRSFRFDDLQPENNSTFRVIHDGLFHNGSFLL